MAVSGDIRRQQQHRRSVRRKSISILWRACSSRDLTHRVRPMHKSIKQASISSARPGFHSTYSWRFISGHVLVMCVISKFNGKMQNTIISKSMFTSLHGVLEICSLPLIRKLRSRVTELRNHQKLLFCLILGICRLVA